LPDLLRQQVGDRLRPGDHLHRDHRAHLHRRGRRRGCRRRRLRLRHVLFLSITVYLFICLFSGGCLKKPAPPGIAEALPKFFCPQDVNGTCPTGSGTYPGQCQLWHSQDQDHEVGGAKGPLTEGGWLIWPKVCFHEL
jgi:hypothetical protein